MAKKNKTKKELALLKKCMVEIAEFNKQCREAVFDDPEDTRTPDNSDWEGIVDNILMEDAGSYEFFVKSRDLGYYDMFYKESMMFGEFDYDSWSMGDSDD